MFWLRIKILRDIKKLHKNFNYNNFTKEYVKLLKLILNSNQHQTITLSILNKINLKILLKISNYNNVEIVDLPIFYVYERLHSVSCYNLENILEFFDFYNNYKIYLLSVDNNNSIRAYIDIEDKEHYRLIRNKKLQKINNL